MLEIKNQAEAKSLEKVLHRIPKHIGIIPDGNRRWGGMCRLSGFLPIQSVYSDFYIVKEMWLDFADEQFENALRWYQKQDVTLGG